MSSPNRLSQPESMSRHRAGLIQAAAVHRPEDSSQPVEEVDWEDPPVPGRLFRSRILVPAVLMVAIIAGTWWTVSWLTTAAVSGPAPTAVAVRSEGDSSAAAGPQSAVSAGASPSATAEVVVHIAGEVHEPGIVRLPPSSRVVDAVEAGGGPTKHAQLHLVNLAAEVTDGAQILIPGPDGVPDAGPSTAAQQASDAPGTAGGTSVNVNTADASELQTLPGIGPALAQRIIDHREQVGPYSSLDDLDAVSGIGPAMLRRLEGQVSW